ncbi:MAG: 16S rRNA processing protein RimM [Chitinophagaceae bacterium]|nr:16S rRNA processing protein RimM [Chitinophagaceae bacterium]MCW5925837.1 16S rRNA processing protein RimM [Chitinophagaceae bacterium]
MNEYFSIGKIVSVFGVSGEVIVSHSLGKKTALKDVKALFIEERKDKPIPYFIESAKAKNEKDILVKLEGVITREQASLLLQKEVWLLEKDFKKLVSKAAPIHLLGYSLVNEGTVLGDITEVIEQPHQLLCKVIVNGNEALIPLHDHTLEKIDSKQKKVHVILPDGLLELYR